MVGKIKNINQRFLINADILKNLKKWGGVF